MLDVQNITKKFKDELVLDDVSFQLSQGEVILLSGENSSGKTTLLLSAAGLIPVQQGKVILDGWDVQKEPQKLRGQIAYVSQDPSLINSLSVRDNLKYWAAASGLSNQQYKEQSQKLTESLGLESVMGKKINSLSGGMKKRVNLAASLFCTPKLLLLDEPFANVDRETKTAIYALLEGYRKAGCSMILVSHIDKEAGSFADRSLTLQGGKLKEG